MWNATATVSGTTTWLRPSVPILATGREIYIPYVATGQYVPTKVFCQPA